MRLPCDFDSLKVALKEAGAVARSFDASSGLFDVKSLKIGNSVMPRRGVTLTRKC